MTYGNYFLSKSPRRNCNTVAYHTAFVRSIFTQEVFFHKVKELTLARADLKFERSRIQQKSRNLNLGFVQIGSSFNFNVIFKVCVK